MLCDKKLNHIALKQEMNLEILFIIRNPREVLLRHSNYNMNFITNTCGYNSSYQVYFENIDYFINYQG